MTSVRHLDKLSLDGFPSIAGRKLGFGPLAGSATSSAPQERAASSETSRRAAKSGTCPTNDTHKPNQAPDDAMVESGEAIAGVLFRRLCSIALLNSFQRHGNIQRHQEG
jgi:hypothetical protein